MSYEINYFPILIKIFEKNNHDLKLCVAMFIYIKKNYSLLPNLSLQKKFFQITLNKGHPYIKG